MDKKLKIARSFGWGAIASLLFIVGVTIAAELSPGLKNFLKELFGHHWVGKSISALLLFLIVSFLAYFIFRKTSLEKLEQTMLILGLVSVFGSLTIFGFYIFHFFVYG